MSFPRSMKHWLKPAAAAAVLTASAAFAQAPPAGGYNERDLIDILNDTQSGFDDADRLPYGPATAPAALPSNVDLNAIRRGLESASADARTLHDSLNAQARRVPAVTQYLGSILQMQARANLLSRQIRSQADLERAVPELRLLDSDWRQVSYGLGGVRDIDRTATALISRLDATGEQITKLLKIGPSVDYGAIVQKTNALRTSVERLIQDVDYEVGRTAEGRQLVLEGQRVQQQAAHLSDTAFQQDSHEHLVQDLRLFQQSWTPFVAKLRGMNSRYVDRDMQEVARNEREVTALLWVEQTFDRQQLLYLTDNLSRDVDEFFDRAQLKIIMRLAESDRALSTADAFYGVFENFVDCVNRGENQAELQDAFAYIDDTWRDFARIYRPINSTEAQQYLNAIEKDITTLRDALLIQQGFDGRKAAELAALVDNLSFHLERDTRNWLTKARPPYAVEAQRDVTNFRHGAQELHEALVAGANLREVRQMCDALFDNWRRVYNHIKKCQTVERSALANTSSQTTPALVELRTLLSR